MKSEFTRKELYDLIWSQPMRTVAASLGMSDVALAKQCKKANIPVPNRGYWARKQFGKPTVQIALPPRFPGASDRVGNSSRHHHYYGSDWVEKFREISVPPIPTFDEELLAVEGRVQKLVGKVRCQRKFEPAHPLVAKLLAHDEEQRQEFNKSASTYYAPKYDAGIERRRLLIINALFIAAVSHCQHGLQLVLKGAAAVDIVGQGIGTALINLAGLGRNGAHGELRQQLADKCLNLEWLRSRDVNDRSTRHTTPLARIRASAMLDDRFATRRARPAKGKDTEVLGSHERGCYSRSFQLRSRLHEASTNTYHLSFRCGRSSAIVCGSAISAEE
jgi:hypothetical protein